MTIKQIIADYSAKLKSSSPILDIEILLTKTLKQGNEYLYAYPEKILTPKQIADFKKMFNRRKKKEPIAYIIGNKEFYGLNFKVNKNVLIPRPETEIIVEEVINYFNNALDPKLKAQSQIADIGVGSGAIIIALAKTIKNARFYGTDISGKALQIAEKNAKTNKVKINFFKGNLLEPLKSKILNLQSNLIITANLPYLTTKQIHSKRLEYEPKIALNGGQDGLKYFHKFFNQIKEFNLQPQAIFLEIGHNQAKTIKKTAKQTLPNYKFKVKKDLCGFDRIVIIKK